jgi:glutathione synthase/RimK-type ligase-like ATP-grasp enzyme
MIEHSLGIIAKDDLSKLNREAQQLYQFALDKFKNVVLIDPQSVHYEFIRGVSIPKIIYKDEDISYLDYLIVRGTRNAESSISILVHTLHECGCLINDPISRFNVGFASKLLSTVTRHSKNIGSTSFFAFNEESITSLRKSILTESHLPLIGKPITGSKGKGVELVSNQEELDSYIDKFTRERETIDYPVFLQKFVNFVSEYRVIVIDKHVIGMALKNKADGEIAANAARGGIFSKGFREDLKQYAEEVVTEYGIYGMDIAIDDKGEFHVIEANRAPLWEEFSRVTDINVAKLQIDRAIERIVNKDNDYQLRTPLGSLD